VSRVFLLSPARCDGERMMLLMRPGARFPLARQTQSRDGAPIGEVFRFTSGLYFRGKLAYAEAFADPPEGGSGALVITSDRGLVALETRVTADDLRAMAAVPVDLREPRYREPLERDLDALAAALDDTSSVVLLGSVATRKYVVPLARALGDRACYPAELRGRGDMQRGSILLRCAQEQRELEYEPISRLRVR
jgi:hypothetical protein